MFYFKNQDKPAICRYGLAGETVIELLNDVSQLLQEVKFDKYVQGNLGEHWKLYCIENNITCDPIKKRYGSRKVKVIIYDS